MKLRFTLLLVILAIVTGCLNFKPRELTSPCVAISSPDGTPVPCEKRRVNDHWLS